MPITKATSLTPCELLALAEEQLAKAMMGGQVLVVDTPQLGRVEFSQANITNAQAYIDLLRRKCAESQGQRYCGGRRPISIQGMP